MTDRFRTAVKKVAEAAPSDLTTFIANTTQRDLPEDGSFRPPSGAPKTQHDLEQEFERFMAELVDRGLIEGGQELDDGDQIILGDVEGMDNWKEVLDSSTQRKYYWNDRTDEVVWEDPRIKDNTGVELAEQESISNQSCGPSPQAGDTEEKLIDLLKKLNELERSVDGEVSDREKRTCAIEAFKELWCKLVESLQSVIFSHCSIAFNEELSEALERVNSLLTCHSQDSTNVEDDLSVSTSKDNKRTQSD